MEMKVFKIKNEYINKMKLIGNFYELYSTDEIFNYTQYSSIILILNYLLIDKLLLYKLT